jgi:NAD(P)-dependent dehydrogenase (short-subunit alcohol dehydrogenase family)
MDLGLDGSAAVVTGGSKGMGLAIAETLAAEGRPRRGDGQEPGRTRRGR